MLLAEAGCVFMAFLLYISGVHGQQKNICAVRGSSVDLPCQTEYPTSSMKWYIKDGEGSKLDLKEISANGNHITYYMSAEGNFTLTIKDLTESDVNVYCCKEINDTSENCRHSEIQLSVADLQVKVIPTTEGETVSLMCSTSCALTENPVVYIWYKNREFLYEDWSPWYQQLVSSEEAVTYSCAVKGHEHLRAPEVSVDSVTSTCFSVTYPKGRVCSYEQTSANEPCSITYPREVRIQRTAAVTPNHVMLTCNTSCPLTDIKWYKSRYLVKHSQIHHYKVHNNSAESFACAAKGLEDLRSAEVCAEDNNCLTVNYASRRICALEGSSVNISSEHSYYNYRPPKTKLWYKIKRSGEEEVEEPIKAAGRVEYHDKMKNHHILRINNLIKNDSAEYRFKLQTDDRWKPGVTLVVSGLRVKFTPSAVVTEDQRVTLTCSTSCPLTDDTNYIWFFNSRPLTLTENRNKHLILDPVSSLHAGNYSCAVKTQRDFTSPEETLTVQSKTGKWTPAAAAGVCATLLFVISLAFFVSIRKKGSSSITVSSNWNIYDLEQHSLGPVYENISFQDDHHYSSLHFSKDHTEDLYFTIKPAPSY